MTDEELEARVYKARGNGAAVITFDDTMALCREIRDATAASCVELGYEMEAQALRNCSTEHARAYPALASAIRAKFNLSPAAPGEKSEE